jgi:hypothetical protein
LLGIEFDFARTSVILLGIDIIIVPVGIWIFTAIERRTKKRGTLAEY